MFWNKKSKSKELPGLPPLPMARTSNRPVKKEEVSEVPNFPEENTEIESNLPELPSPPEANRKEKNFKAVEIEESEEIENRFESKPKNNDVFVKIDKFNSAKKALEAAQLKIDEMQELLKVIRETKMREEQELDYWEKETATARAHVQQVTENLFGKAE